MRLRWMESVLKWSGGWVTPVSIWQTYGSVLWFIHFGLRLTIGFAYLPFAQQPKSMFGICEWKPFLWRTSEVYVAKRVSHTHATNTYGYIVDVCKHINRYDYLILSSNPLLYVLHLGGPVRQCRPLYLISLNRIRPFQKRECDRGKFTSSIELICLCAKTY